MIIFIREHNYAILLSFCYGQQNDDIAVNADNADNDDKDIQMDEYYIDKVSLDEFDTVSMVKLAMYKYFANDIDNMTDEEVALAIYINDYFMPGEKE